MPKTTPNLGALLEIMLQALPLHAEEGPRRESLEEAMLIARLAASEGSSPEAAALVTALLRRTLQALALLDRMELAAGRWTFVSFSAALLGRSLLETLATTGQTALPADYWEEGDHRPAALKEEQRRLLQRIENERVLANPDARAIRVVHVAWGVIRIQDRFLLCRREDIARPGEKTHVLPGGRLNISDLPDAARAAPDVLRQLMDPYSALARANLQATLARELREELELLPDIHYTAELRQDLPPYRRVSGAGNRYVYTTYSLRLYAVRLTPAGETRVLEQEVAGALRPTWFSADEIAASQRANGDAAYVDALHAAWGAELRQQLLAFPQAIDTSTNYGAAEPLDLPAAPNAGLDFGKPGKERRRSTALSDATWHLLLLLGGHARGCTISDAQGFVALGRGWVKITEESLMDVALELQQRLNKRFPGLIEIRDAAYARLTAHQDAILFSPGWFEYSIQGSPRAGGQITVLRTAVETPWGRVDGDSIVRPINANAIRILRELERGDEPSVTDGIRAGDWEKNLRDQLLGEIRSLGLRRLWTTRQGTSSLVEGIRSIAPMR
jgi:hypothetical protein